MTMSMSSVNVSGLAQRIWLPTTLLMLAIISITSLSPLAELPDIPGSDKLHHFVSYAALMMPAFLVRYAKRLWLMLVFLIWGGAVELIQPYVNRYAEWADLFANGTGLLIGAALGAMLSLLISKTSR